MDVRFTILGPVEISVEGRSLTGAAPRHRAVLAYLLLHARTVLGADRLVTAVWGADPPETSRAQIHSAVTTIRRVLREAEAGAAGLLATRGAGYVIEPGPGGFDLDEFTDHVAVAQKLAVNSGEAAAAQRLRAALALWQGTPLADVNAAYVDEARARLEERRLRAVERMADLELSLGRHEDLIDELAAEVAAQPLRERLCGQFMLALYRAGRQADALAAGRVHRAALAEQHGLDPSRTFQALEQSILRDDPRLNRSPKPGSGAATETAPGAAPRAAAGADPPDDAAGPRPPDAVPERRPRRANFLPYDTPDFAGRAEELDRLADPRSGAGTVVTISAIDGMAGVGKTALAIHAAHRLADRFPDGQLFVDLQAHTAGREPISSEAALETLLRQVGVPADRIPASLPDRAALWRAELAGRRVLAVVDNAADTDHVRPLLPGGSGSLILITSRRRLTGLDGAHALSVDLLPAADAVALFSAIVGERADAAPIAVLDVLQLCGFLPLAVRIAAARLRHRPRWTVEYLAGRLRDQRRRLTELATSERSVAAAFHLSYQQLSPAHRRMFRLLGLHPGPDIDARAAAALADLSGDRAEDLLEDLLDAHVLSQRDPGRYVFHDLLREHAHATASAEETPEARDEALTRLFDAYLHTAGVAIDLLYPYGRTQRPSVAEPGAADVSFATEEGALAWLDAERANLIAVGTRTADGSRTSTLAAVLRPYLDAHAHHAGALALLTTALENARSRGDRAGEAVALVDLGWTYWRQGHYEQAGDCSERALTACEQAGDRLGESRARNTLGVLCLARGDHEQAYKHLQRALDLCRAIGNQVGEAHVLGNLGIDHEQRGRYDQARDHLQQARLLHRELGNRAGEARVLDNLGLLYQRQGDYEQARHHHRQALELYRRLGNQSDETRPLNALGELARAMGDLAQALDDHRSALSLARERGNRPEQARAHDGLARAHRDLGRTAPAREHGERALVLYTELGVPEADDLRRFLDKLT